jgi:hypothetical protein
MHSCIPEPTRLVTAQGNLRLNAAGINWKKAGGGRSVDIPVKDVDEISYMAGAYTRSHSRST